MVTRFIFVGRLQLVIDADQLTNIDPFCRFFRGWELREHGDGQWTDFTKSKNSVVDQFLSVSNN